MPVHPPGPRLGHSIPLKHARERLKGKGRRSMYASLLLTSLIDMFVILTLFLVQNFAATGEVLFISKEIVLPKAKVTSELQRAPVVAISAKNIALEGEKVVDTSHVQARREDDLPELGERLAELKRKSLLLQPDREFDPNIIVQSDTGVDYGVVRRVLFACAQEGYTNVRFAVLQAKR